MSANFVADKRVTEDAQSADIRAPVAREAGRDGSDRALRVIYFSLSFPELTQTFVFNEMRALRDEGVEVSVVALRMNNPTLVAAPGWRCLVGWHPPAD